MSHLGLLLDFWRNRRANNSLRPERNKVYLFWKYNKREKKRGEKRWRRREKKCRESARTLNRNVDGGFLSRPASDEVMQHSNSQWPFSPFRRGLCLGSICRHNSTDVAPLPSRDPPLEIYIYIYVYSIDGRKNRWERLIYFLFLPPLIELFPIQAPLPRWACPYTTKIWLVVAFRPSRLCHNGDLWRVPTIY